MRKMFSPYLSRIPGTAPRSSLIPFKDLGLAELMASIKHNSKIKYDLTGYLRLLVYGRILDPASKLATVEKTMTIIPRLCRTTRISTMSTTLWMSFMKTDGRSCSA